MRSGSATEVPPNFWTTSAMRAATLPVPLADRETLTWSAVVLRRAGGQRTPGFELGEELALGGLRDGAQRTHVVTADREHPTVEVAALEDDGAQVAHHRAGLGDIAQRPEVEHHLGGALGPCALGGLALTEQDRHRHVVEL